MAVDYRQKNVCEGVEKLKAMMEFHDSEQERTGVQDLAMDTMVICASKLELRDLVNMAGVCRQFRDAAYADSIWEAQCKRQWSAQKASGGGTFQFLGGRDAFVRRYFASQQFRFSDPVDWPSYLPFSPINHILLENDSIVVAQGPNISILSVVDRLEQPRVVRMLRDHNARITCMRLLPQELVGSIFRSGMMGPNSDVLVTSSSDHTIRVWGHNRPRTFRGHSGPVNTLADRLLGRNDYPPVLASGGEDGTVRLWSLKKRTPLLTTFHGHGQPVRELVVAGHNNSILVSASRDLKIRVWDVNAKATTGGGCVGTVNGPGGSPIKMLCDGATCFVAGGNKVLAVDLRSMRNVATVAVHENILSFARSPNGFVFGTGGREKTAKLWDMRMCEEDQPEPWVTLGDHAGPVQCLHVDQYKVVSGGTGDRFVRVWDANTGDDISTLDTINLDPSLFWCGVSAMAVQGTRLVTGTCGDVSGVLRYRDFSNCTTPYQDSQTANEEPRSGLRFWDGGFGESC